MRRRPGAMHHLTGSGPLHLVFLALGFAAAIAEAVLVGCKARACWRRGGSTSAHKAVKAIYHGWD